MSIFWSDSVRKFEVGDRIRFKDKFQSYRGRDLEPLQLHGLTGVVSGHKDEGKGDTITLWIPDDPVARACPYRGSPNPNEWFSGTDQLEFDGTPIYAVEWKKGKR